MWIISTQNKTRLSLRLDLQLHQLVDGIVSMGAMDILTVTTRQIWFNPVPIYIHTLQLWKHTSRHGIQNDSTQYYKILRKTAYTKQERQSRKTPITLHPSTIPQTPLLQPCQTPLLPSCPRSPRPVTGCHTLAACTRAPPIKPSRVISHHPCQPPDPVPSYRLNVQSLDRSTRAGKKCSKQIQRVSLSLSER